MKQVRATELPEVRAEVINQFRQEATFRHLHDNGIAKAHQIREELDRQARLATNMEMFHVSPAMCHLALSAAKTLEFFAVSREDLPAPSGMIVFDTTDSHVQVAYSGGRKVPMRGTIWLSSADRSSWMAMPMVDPIGDLGRGDTLAVDPAMWCGIDFGAKVPKSSLQKWDFRAEMTALLITTWLLMRQPLAKTSTQEPDRATRKRVRRLGAEPATVRLIDLRRPSLAASQGDGSSNYQHQWIVRGHWRNHWHPKRQVHRPVWIAPHVKGPEGAPMIGGEKVYVLRGEDQPETPA